MAAAGYSPVMVQEKCAPPPGIDLAAESATHSAYHAPKPSASMASKSHHYDDEHSDNASLYEEILDEVEPFDYSTGGPDTCTAEEARNFRQRLHDVGAGTFIFETITLGKVSARKLCTAFGVRVPKFLEGAGDEGYYEFLGHAISRELQKRQRLPQYNSIDDAARLLREKKNIMIITGAGISTSLGIPDFRSKNTGFYTKLREAGHQDPEDVFDIRNFDEDPQTFYDLAGDILPDLRKWTPTHQFIRLLQDKGKLLRNYTQNIDNVESHAGIMREKLIQCHGSWATATCRKCDHKIPGEEIFDDIRAHIISRCKSCEATIASQKPGMKRKRSSNTSKKRRAAGDDDDDSDGAYDIPEPGVMKPDITFFGEALPSDFFDRLKNVDRNKADLVVVIGTSMKVAPVSEIPNILGRDVPQIYISRDPIHHINFDINLLGNCDEVVAELCRRAGWDLKHEMIPEAQIIDVEPAEQYEAAFTVKARSKMTNGVVKKESIKPEVTLETNGTGR